MSLTDSGHFIALGDLPYFEGSTSLAQVYEQLANEINGGGFIVNGPHGDVYVKAAALVEEILRRVIAEVMLDRPLSEDEGRAIKAKLEQIADQPIEQVVAQSIQEAAVVAVHQEPIPPTVAEGEIWNQHDRVFRIEAEGQTVGWHLNHEGVRSTTTEKPSYRCTNPGGSHKNTSFDHGGCSYCPWPLLRT